MHRLAGKDEAGMRLQIPDHLQKTFRALMNLSYKLKKKHPTLKRSVKFDEDSLDMFIDIQTKPDTTWRRIDPGQALAFNERHRKALSNTIGQDELDELLGGTAAK